MKKIVAFILLSIPSLTFAQQTVSIQEDPTSQTVKNLQYVFDVPVCKDEIAEPDPTGKFKYNAGCGDRLFWQVVELKLKAVPFLIELIENTENTQAKLPEGKGYYRTGDVAIMALREIIHELPVEEYSEVKYSSYSQIWKYYHKGLKNAKKRKALREGLEKWYAENKAKFIFEKADTYGNCMCLGKNPAGGYFTTKKPEPKKDEAPRKTE